MQWCQENCDHGDSFLQLLLHPSPIPVSHDQRRNEATNNVWLLGETGMETDMQNHHDRQTNDDWRAGADRDQTHDENDDE